MNKWIGGLTIVLALVIAIVPLFSDCLSQGRSLKTESGMSVPMKCHWTALAEVGMGIPLALAGVLHFTSKRKETFTSLGILGVTLGALTVAFPTVLIGVCSNPDMMCNLVERPVLIFAGTLVIAASLVNLYRTRQMAEQVA